MDIWDFFLGCLLLPWVWRALYFVRLTISACRFASCTGKEGRTPNFIIFIPAHNEAACIAQTLQSLASIDYPDARQEVLVIADNCTDATATIARESGAGVLERSHEKLRGKGYALEYAIDHIKQRSEPPDAIVIIDADTHVASDILQVFARSLNQGSRFMQAYYTVANPDDSWRTKLMTYALSLFNGICLMGLVRMGLGATLRGNGMCFSWQGLQSCPLRSYGLAEDMEYSWHLRLQGERVDFVPQTQVYGEMVRDAKTAVSQRQRWESGRKVLRQQFRQQILQASQHNWYRRLLMLSELYMWPLGRLLFWTLLAIILATGKLAYVGTSFFSSALLLLQFAFLLAFACYAALPFLKMGLPWRYGLAVIYAPLYFFWKLSLLFKRGPKAWVRTTRNDERPGR
ncbi:MAG: glycosyltransferase family 2 protein [Oligoflexus sp.]